MRIEWLRIKHVRNVLALELRPHPAFNVFHGPNGSGKTAVLEAIHCLSRCRSFRDARVERVVNREHKTLQVSAGLCHAGLGRVVTGVERGHGHIRIRFNHASVNKVSAQAAQLPVIAITPDSHELITGSPRHRRKWLDWALFHVEPAYLTQWRDYHKALRQRSHLLKSGKAHGLEAWEARLEQAAAEINRARLAYLAVLLEELRQLCDGLALPCPRVDYRQGWPAERALSACLRESRGADYTLGRTQYGAHRSELAITAEDGFVAHSWSRGRIRLLINALSWAQARVLHRRTGNPPALLADDLLAELDQAAQRRILQVCHAYAGQVFVTTTHDPAATDLSGGKLFHMKHGAVAG